MKKSGFPFFLFTFLGAIVVLPSQAQEPAYLHYTVNDGLPSAVVYCAVQDDKGFMWFGTDKGLVRFDGTRFKVYGMKDGLPDNEVVNIFKDSKGRIWLSCFGQHPVYYKDGVITSADTDTMLAKVKKAGNFNFFEDKQQRIWIGSNSRYLYCFHDKGIDEYQAKTSLQKVGEFGGSLFAIGNWFIYDLAQKKAENIRFTSPYPFLPVSAETLQNLKDGNKNIKSSEFDFFSKTRHAAAVQSGNRVLYLYKEGLLLLEYDENGSFREVDRRMGVPNSTAFSDSEGRIWVSSSDEGAFCFDHRKEGLRHPEKYMDGVKVSQIYEDKENNIWFLTLHAGAYSLPKNAVQTYRVGTKSPLRSNNVYSVSKTLDGRLVAGDDKGHIYVKKHNFWKVITIRGYVGYNRVRQILQLKDSSWMVVSDKTIVFEKQGNFNLNNPVGSYKSACIHNGRIWAGTSLYLINSDKTKGEFEIVAEERTMFVFSDVQNTLWAGTLSGLFSEKDGFKKSWADKFPPLASRIIDIRQAENDALWIATPDYGLLKVGVNKGEVTSVEIINEKLSKPIENIQSIFAEPNGNVWLSTNKGVYSLEPNGTIGHYSQHNGLASDDVNAVYVDKDTMWAATVSGLSKLLLRQNGESADFSTRIVVIKYIDGTEKHFDISPNIPGFHKITIPPGAKMLEVELASLHFRTRGNLQFEYRTQEMLLPIHALTFGNIINCLFGKDVNLDTIQGSVQNFGLSLTPGRFLNTATAILPGNVRSSQPDSIIITVLPHWWETIWTVLFTAVAVGFGIIRIFRGRAAYLKLQSTASELHLQAIKSQMNPHFVGNSINAIQQFFYPPDPLKASEYISIFSDLLRKTMTFSEIDFIPFHDELQYVKDYLEMVKLRFGEHFNYTINGVEQIDPNTLFPAMVLQPLLENATIHGLSPEGKSKITLTFEMENNRMTCILTDNGVGVEESLRRKQLNPTNRPSKGLQLLEKKLQMLNKLYNKDIKLETLDLAKLEDGGGGTCVTLSFSVISLTKAKFGSKFLADVGLQSN